MRKTRFFAAMLAAIMSCGCSEKSESSSVPVYTVIESSSSNSSAGSSSSSSASSSGDVSYSDSSTSPESEEPTVDNPVFSSTEDEEIPYDQRSSTGVVWNPLSTTLTYDFNSADIIKGLEEKYEKTGGALGYTGEWCAEIISDLLIDDGYKISPQYNPCDLAIQLLNKGYAHFYCLREENYDSLVYYGLNKKGQSNVIMTTHEDFVPQRGDLVCFLWLEENDIYNWSHIGMVAEDYDGTVLRTIEGNVGTEDLPDDPRARAVGGREREYNETVVGFIRLDV
ncbi:MAG: CHAP domain-containing protein [Oscillospiraceae bacterium]